MKNVLHITTSIMGEDSVSSTLMDELLAKFATQDSLEVTQRNFANESIPHLDGPWLAALSTAEADRNSEQQAKVAFSDQLIAELQAADTLLIGLPMYNFSLPSMLKAWIDHIARAGLTFTYTENGPEGLLEDKKVYLVTAMGGIHETAATDFLRPYMKHILAFVGLTDVEFITANGLNMGPQSREKGLASARSQIENAVSNEVEEVAA
jgi:FMN-dependent NADH-azoreductase